jgi:hypothetical protein
MPDSFYAALAALPLSIVFGGARQALKVQNVSATGSRISSGFLRSVTEISLLLLILFLPFAAILILPAATPRDLLLTSG